MKKSLLPMLALSLATGAMAQMPDGSVCPDFTGTDLDGNVHHLYDYLDQGYTVVVDVSATWCGPCWSYHNSGNLEGLFEDHGPGTADDKVMVLFIEGDNSTTLADLNGTGSNTQGDWVTGTPYPIINSASIANLLQISYYPTIYTICPNRIMVESGQISEAAHWNLAQACPVADSPFDAALLEPQTTMAGCTGADLPLHARLQNMGTSTLTNANIQVKQGTTVLGSTTWSGLLPTYGIADVAVTDYAFGANANLTFEITSSDDDAANNTTSGSVVVSNQEIGTWVTVEVRTDGYGYEVTWQLTDASGYPLWTNPASVGNNTTYSTTLALNDGECYIWKIQDSYGDGILSPGYWKILNDGVAVMQSSGAFTSTVKPFKGSLAADVAEAMKGREPSIYPNPTNGQVTLAMDVPAGTRATLDVYNVLGAVVKSQIITNAISTVDLNTLDNGVYYFNINANGVTTTRKVTVNK